jgi:hypothetical protein
MMGTSIRVSKGVSCWPMQFLRTTGEFNRAEVTMRTCWLLAIVLFAGVALAQQSRTYGFILNENGGIKGADCSLVDNVKGCQLFNELVSADDTFAASLSMVRTSLACFVTDDPSQSSMFFVFSLSPRSNLSSTLTIYGHGLPVNLLTFKFSPNQFGGFDLKPAGDDNYRGSLDEDLLSFHKGVGIGMTKTVDWDYWYFDINMKTGRLKHVVDRRISTGRCARHDEPNAN